MQNAFVKVASEDELSFSESNIHNSADFKDLDEQLLGGAIAGLQAAQSQIEAVIKQLLEKHNLENST